MISKLKLLYKYLNLLLIFLFPTQLAIHFWPNFALIFGIRVDYLSPTIFLTDILFILLFILWFAKNRIEFKKDLGKSKYLVLSFSILIILNLISSSSFQISALKWLKIIEFVLVAYYVNKNREIFTVKNISISLFFSLIAFSVVGLLQFVRGQTFGNIFYLIGERSFSIFTPGIALVNIFGRNFLRVYSTFSHPNSLAGFIGASSIFLIFNFRAINKTLMKVGIILISLAFALTFSLSAFVGLVSCLIIYKIFKSRVISKRFINLTIIFIFILSLYFAVFSKPILQSNYNFSLSTRQRLELGNMSGKIFAKHWILGTGLNTFIPNEVLFSNTEKNVWLLQPVHNIYLLIFTEVGIVGIIFLYICLFRALQKIILTKRMDLLLVILFVMITGLFDHYWFTIQQNDLLLSLFLGISSREKI